MLLKTFSTRLLGVNTYVLACEVSGETAIIDPACKPALIMDLIRAKNLKVKYILNTHGHIDHIWRNKEMRQHTGAPIHIHDRDAHLLEMSRWWLAPIKLRTRLSPAAGVLVKDGDSLPLGLLNIEVIHTPGHTPGGVSYRVKKTIFSGDTLFAGGIGRVDLKGGDLQTILSSIRDKLLILSDDIRVYPGHGPETTIQRERLYNPFLRAKDKILERIMLPKRKRSK